MKPLAEVELSGFRLLGVDGVGVDEPGPSGVLEEPGVGDEGDEGGPSGVAGVPGVPGVPGTFGLPGVLTSGVS